GVVWDDPAPHLDRRVQVRTRSVTTGTWSHWQHVATHHADHAPDPGTPDPASGPRRAATPPLAPGAPARLQMRVPAHAAPAPRAAAGAADASRAGATTAEATAASAASAGLAPLGAAAIPALSREQTERELLAPPAETGQQAKPYIGPRPAITTRRGWGASESLR